MRPGAAGLVPWFYGASQSHLCVGPESMRHPLRARSTTRGPGTSSSAPFMPKAPTGIHDVASMSAQDSKEVGQPQNQVAVRSSMGA